MATTSGALGQLAPAVLELACGQGRLMGTAMSDVAREQRISNRTICS
ncbi:hypothetical protein [Streptomyces sp. NPDC048142]